MDFLLESDPDVAAAILSEEHRQRDELELIASENYTSAAVMEAVGSVLTNKYAEGLPGKPVLRRLRVRRQGRAARHRPRQGRLRLGSRQRPAALGSLGQPGGLLRLPGARRHRPGDGPGPRRAPHPRDEAQLLRPVVSHDRLRPRPRDRADRLRQARRPGPRAQAEAGPRRRQRLRPDDRFRPDRRGRPGDRRRVLRRHGAHRRGSSPPACTPTRCRWPTSSRPPRTRPCEARAAGSCSAPRNGPRRSTRPSSPGSRAAR